MVGNIDFNLPKDKSSIIKVIGVGGGGCNAVNYMYSQGITDVDFVVCNTDNQALDSSDVPVKIRLGNSGLGAGSIPEVGRQLAIESKEQLVDAIQANTKMLFITAGMGGGTGTGAAPVIAQLAREHGILTVAIVTTPFKWEGKKRENQAKEGIARLRENVDTMIVVANQKLKESYGTLGLKDSFAMADKVLATAAKSISEMITKSGYVNVDFQDVRTVLSNSGTSLVGYGIAEGENRAKDAVDAALDSPLLNDGDIKGASNILLNIVSGSEQITTDELDELAEYVQVFAGGDADIIFGQSFDESLGNQLAVTIIATGFPSTSVQPEKKVINLGDVNNDMASTNSVKTDNNSETGEIILNTNNSGKIIRTLYDEDSRHNSADTDSLGNSEPYAGYQDDPLGSEEMDKKHEERFKNIRSFSLNLSSSEQVERMEKEPAYMRKEVEFADVPSSAEPIMSSSSVNCNTYVLRRNNNRFLNPNVD